MKIKVTTETGSFYHIDTETGRWSKNKLDMYSMLSHWTAGPYEEREQNAMTAKGNWHDIDYPEVGNCMYISARGIYDWYITTPVVSVEENPEDWDTRLDYEGD